MESIRVSLLSDKARKPSRATPGAAGFDLFATSDLTLAPGHRALVSTDLAVAMPRGTYGRIAPRSGLALRHGIDVMAGVVDGDYRGAVGVILVNLGQAPFDVHAGLRVAQLIPELYCPADLSLVEAPLDDTPRGASGFGSSGSN